jgi:hypothetical protein
VCDNIWARCNPVDPDGPSRSIHYVELGSCLIENANLKPKTTGLDIEELESFSFSTEDDLQVLVEWKRLR